MTKTGITDNQTREVVSGVFRDAQVAAAEKAHALACAELGAVDAEIDVLAPAFEALLELGATETHAAQTVGLDVLQAKRIRCVGRKIDTAKALRCVLRMNTLAFGERA